MEDRIILDLCGGTRAWSKPYSDAGYHVIDVELRRGSDVRLFEYPGPVHGILAAPPCTHFATAGARYWKEKGEAVLPEALSIVDACLRIVVSTKPKWWCLENPKGRLRTWLGPPVCTFQPWEYGDPWTKITLLWGNFNIPLKTPVKPLQGSIAQIAPGGVHQAWERSITPPGFAEAFFRANP